MARKTFFSFHYERDSWRAGQVRNCNLLPSDDQRGFIDSVDWESIKRQGDDAIKRWIDGQLEYTSATVVLIGAETAGRPWVQHEIVRSWNRGNGILGVRIHNIKDQHRETDLLGPNPFVRFELPDGTLLSAVCKTYDWVTDDGRNHLGEWIEEAFKIGANYGARDEIVSVDQVKEKPARASTPRPATASAGFVPRSPWSANHVAMGR